MTSDETIDLTRNDDQSITVSSGTDTFTISFCEVPRASDKAERPFQRVHKPLLNVNETKEGFPGSYFPFTIYGTPTENGTKGVQKGNSSHFLAIKDDKAFAIRMIGDSKESAFKVKVKVGGVNVLQHTTQGKKSQDYFVVSEQKWVWGKQIGKKTARQFRVFGREREKLSLRHQLRNDNIKKEVEIEITSRRRPPPTRPPGRSSLYGRPRYEATVRSSYVSSPSSSSSSMSWNDAGPSAPSPGIRPQPTRPQRNYEALSHFGSYVPASNDSPSSSIQRISPGPRYFQDEGDSPDNNACLLEPAEGPEGPGAVLTPEPPSPGVIVVHAPPSPSPTSSEVHVMKACSHRIASSQPVSYQESIDSDPEEDMLPHQMVVGTGGLIEQIVFSDKHPEWIDDCTVTLKFKIIDSPRHLPKNVQSLITPKHKAVGDRRIPGPGPGGNWREVPNPPTGIFQGHAAVVTDPDRLRHDIRSPLEMEPSVHRDRETPKLLVKPEAGSGGEQEEGAEEMDEQEEEGNKRDYQKLHEVAEAQPRGLRNRKRKGRQQGSQGGPDLFAVPERRSRWRTSVDAMRRFLTLGR